MFSQRLKSARKAQGLTQVELAKLVPTSQSYIAQLESSDRLPSMDMLKTIADTLGVSPSYLIGGTLNNDEGKDETNPRLARLAIIHDQQTPPGLRDLAADAALCSMLDVQPWELKALRSLDVPSAPSKDGYLMLLLALRTACPA